MSRQWDQAVTQHIARYYEELTGRIQLTFLTEAEEDALLVMYREGVKPLVAANRIIDGRKKQP